MGQAFIDVAALRAVANRMDDSAELVAGAARSQLAGLGFGGTVAGRAHVASGDALHTAVSRITDELSQWTRASFEIAAALRAGADRYAEADRRGAARIG
ncbi:type VII secretion target [Mycobacterium branderi]|uniref:ESX-1 secretion-associated protein n=1 Tax=Mycobacterium branderi TaxID=43348 RepID=A0A7I7W0R4_9MYCO|nr:type VII secretion target [Mycobacterium branderi]MCV7233230.1 ESX-1 secretion-associated protein [Mycobacterium branderi]ORA41303.1 hypothetical protein BST20_04115 [Mycobacterium branderi]BBZ10345.1 hypothetical protein MBRA_05400 [Mycobacterium branderi]